MQRPSYQTKQTKKRAFSRPTRPVQNEVSSNENRIVFFHRRQNQSDKSQIQNGSSDQERQALERRIQQSKKYSDQLHRTVAKILYKEVILESKRQDYNMFCYKLNTKNQKQKDTVLIISKHELQKSQVKVDGKAFRCFDKIAYLAK